MSREDMKQPEALWLADALDDEFTQGRISNHNGRKAATELRRLHDLVCVCGAVWEGETMVHPPRKREWVGLTDEEINSVRYKRDWTAHWTDMTFARAIEAKLREKNHE
jgi:hypothetical protein